MVCSRCKRDLPKKAFNPADFLTGRITTWCKVCKRDYQKEYARQRKNNPEFKQRHKENARVGRLLFYGITEQDYDDMLELQGGGCAGCGYKPKPGKRLNVDHKHQLRDKQREPWERASHVRGLLCHRCNRTLGMVRDDVQTLKNLIAYLECPPAVQVVLPLFKRLTEYLEAYAARRPAEPPQPKKLRKSRERERVRQDSDGPEVRAQHRGRQGDLGADCPQSVDVRHEGGDRPQVSCEGA